jgi:hypothetical protein
VRVQSQRFTVPALLPALVDVYSARNPEPVRFRTPSWDLALADVAGEPTRLLSDTTITSEPTNQRHRSTGDRIVAPEAVAEVCRTIDLSDNGAVVAAFVLVMAWGSGTSNSRSLRYTRSALQDVKAAASVLCESASAVRAVAEIDSDDLAAIHRRFSLPGVREPFFTKWFSFAGANLERAWQPLILDSRVRKTLNRTLDVWLNDLTTKRNDPYRYIAYLTAMHAWADELPQKTTASRLEWILFMHNGKPA